MASRFSSLAMSGSFQFVPQSSVVPPFFFFVYILPFPSFIHVIDHFLRSPWLSYSPLCFPNQIINIEHTFLDIVPLHFLSLSIQLLQSPSWFFWGEGNLMIFFNLVQNFATSKQWSQSVSSPGIVCKSFVLFSNRCFTSTYSNRCRLLYLGSCQGYGLLLGFLNHVLVLSPFLSQNSISISTSQSVWSNSVSVWLISNHTVPFSHCDGICVTFSILCKNIFDCIVHFFHFVISIPQCWRIHFH